MFGSCPRCNKFQTRFETKWHFSLTTSKDEDTYPLIKERLGQFDGKGLCYNCYRKVNRQEDSLFMASMLVTLLAKLADANMPKDDLIKCANAFLTGYSKRT